MAFLDGKDLNPFDDLAKSYSTPDKPKRPSLDKKLAGDKEVDKSKSIKKLTLGDIEKFLASGRERGEMLTGASSEDIGQKRGEIRSKYEGILDSPSRGAARVSDARNADLKRLRQGQSQSGVTGPMASAQQTQMSQDYAGKIGDVRQKEYLDALNKLEAQYRGASADVMSAEGQYGSIGVGGKASPTVSSGGGITYICTELNRRGLVSKIELLAIHILLAVGTLLKPAQTLFYLKFGAGLVENLKKSHSDMQWEWLKVGLFDVCFDHMKKLRFKKAICHYEKITKNLFFHYGYAEQLSKAEFKWALSDVTESFKIMRRRA